MLHQRRTFGTKPGAPDPDRARGIRSGPRHGTSLSPAQTSRRPWQPAVGRASSAAAPSYRRRTGIDRGPASGRRTSDRRAANRSTETKSGRRDIEVPSLIWKDLQLHLDVYVKPSNDAFVFTGPKGAMLRRSNYQRTWRKGLAKAGLTDRGLHFHDLRHTGNTWHAESGATVRERMGHSSTKAALIYIHSRDGRQRLLAEAMSERLAEALRTDPASESAMH